MSQLELGPRHPDLPGNWASALHIAAIHIWSARCAWQLLGYLLLDTADRFRIDTLGLCLTRSSTLVSWPVEDYLALLGARHRNLSILRALFAELCAGCPADEGPLTPAEVDRIHRLLQRAWSRSLRPAAVRSVLSP